MYVWVNLENTDLKKRGSRLSNKPGGLDCRDVVFEAVETDVKKTVKNQDFRVSRVSKCLFFNS